MSDYLLVCTTVETLEQARPIAERVIHDRLAACVQMEPVQSIYRWKGQVENASEIRLSFKTTAERKAVLLETLRSIHPYELPELIVLPIQDGSHPYLSWIRESVAPSPQ